MSYSEVVLYENQHVIDPKLDYVTPYEDTFPYMVTAGNTILAAIKEGGDKRINCKFSNTYQLFYFSVDAYTWPGESDDGGYLKPLNLASSRKGWESNTSQNVIQFTFTLIGDPVHCPISVSEYQCCIRDFSLGPVCDQ